MPTAGRRRWVPHAIRYFLRQDYPNRELVIVDDGEDAVDDLLPDDPRIRYFRTAPGLSLGAKRNVCIESSRGDLILHWDDDDWSAPRRIRKQVSALLDAGADVCGMPRMLYYDLRARRTWLYEYADAEHRRWLAGNSLLYTRDFWQRTPFPDVRSGEDTLFLWSHSLDRAVAVEDAELQVAILHARNTSPKLIGHPGWTPWPGDVRGILGNDLGHYEPHPRTSEILVPSFGQEEYTVRCFDSLREHTNDYRLVWIDNGSSGPAVAAVQPAFERHPDRLFLRCDRNLGFVGAINLGLRAVLADPSSDADSIVFLNNDTEVTAGWLDRLTAALDLEPLIAAAGPMTSPSGCWQAWTSVFAMWHEPVPEGLAAASPAIVSEIMADRFGDTVTEAEMLAFFCTAFRTRVFDEVGLLDPGFGAGLADDDDYCFRLRAAGYALLFVPGAYALHHHRTTFRALYSDAEIAAMQRENYDRFLAKHVNK